MPIQPYLFFEGRCEEAAEFYRQAIGAEVMMVMRYKDCPDSPPPGMIPPGSEDKVMHMTLRIGDSEIMGSDGMCSGRPSFQGFSLSLPAADEAEAKRFFEALSDGGKVEMPLGKTFFSSCFGMLQDRFGLGWMVIVPAE